MELSHFEPDAGCGAVYGRPVSNPGCGLLADSGIAALDLCEYSGNVVAQADHAGFDLFTSGRVHCSDNSDPKGWREARELDSVAHLFCDPSADHAAADRTRPVHERQRRSLRLRADEGLVYELLDLLGGEHFGCGPDADHHRVRLAAAISNQGEMKIGVM